MQKIPLTVVVLAHNEEANLSDCLASVSFADDILVMDSESTDNTKDLALKLGARVITRPLNDDFSNQRNFAIENSKHEWILMLDSDERVTVDLKEQIIKAVAENKDLTYQISRENHFEQGIALHGVLRPDYVERLFKKAHAHYEGRIHERLVSTASKQKLKGRLIHFTYKSWSAHLQKMDLYTTLLAQKYYEKGKKVVFLRDILFKPFWAFFKMYIIHLGFLDGALGFKFSFLHATYTMEKYLKLESLNKYKGKI